MRRTIWHRLADGEVELHTLQALCLNSWNAFYRMYLECTLTGAVEDRNTNKLLTVGDTVTAELDLSLANQLIHALVPRDFGSHGLEFFDCVRSLAVLKYHHSSVMPSASPLCASTWIIGRSSNHYNVDPGLSVDDNEDVSNLSVSRVAAELGRVWYMARQYTAVRPAADGPPPWMPNSDFAEVMVEHQRWESTAPRQYRFAANRLDDHDLADLHANRQYWSPWIHMQILFAGIPCLLNHPFLLAIRLRGFRHAMPQSFIQQSYEQITRHAGCESGKISALGSKAELCRLELWLPYIAAISQPPSEHWSPSFEICADAIQGSCISSIF